MAEAQSIRLTGQSGCQRNPVLVDVQREATLAIPVECQAIRSVGSHPDE